MKKARNVYILVGIIVLCAVLMIGSFFFLKDKGEETSVNGNSGVSDEDYLLMNSLEKAPVAENLIFLEEGKDCSFVYGEPSLKKAAKDICDSFFDGVIVKSTLLSGKNATLTEAESEKLQAICRYFTEKNKKAYVFCSAYLSEESFASFRSYAHGVVIDLSEVTSSQADKLSAKLKKIRAELPERELLAFTKDSELISLIDKSLLDSVFLSVNNQQDAEALKALQLEFSESAVSFSAFTDLSLYGRELHAEELLRSYYSLKDASPLDKRAFSSYSDARNNPDNAYEALRTYFTQGISPILAFRTLTVKDYEEGEKLSSKESFYKLKLSGSYLFPVYVNGKSAGILPKGVGEIRLDLVRGVNDFTLTQSGNSAECSVEYNFEGDIIQSISPADKIKVFPGEEMVVMVVAYKDAEVFVKLGATKYPAKKQETTTDFTAFYAGIKMPEDIAELSSLERISAVATLGNQTQQLDGATITPVALGNAPVFTTSMQNFTSFNIQNYNPTYIDVEQQVMPSISAAISKATTNAYNTPYTGNQTAVVATEYADVMPSGGDFVPYYNTLAKGTKDFIIGESQFFDNEENEWYYYYDLACGLKISRDSVTLEPSTPMPENSLRVNSVYGSDGELTIRLGSTWKVPYTMSFADQNYYSSNSSPYYVSEFTASAVSLTFIYTTSATGEIDCSLSDVVSSASWSVSPEKQTATLNLPFRERGVYYGCSIYYEGDETVITIKNRQKSLAGSVVVLDPGHGADDCGATGLSGTVKESDINILVAYQVKSYLESQGVTVYMTRYADDDINLSGRKIFARSVKPDLYVSIHSNASEKKESIGTSAFYYKAFSMPLATNIYNEIVSVYRNYLYPGRQDVYDDIARGVKYYPFSVTRLDEFPSVLIELGFMTNDYECYLLTVPQNQQLLGQAIAKGICDTLLM